MKFIQVATALLVVINGHKLNQKSSDEVDDLLAK